MQREFQVAWVGSVLGVQSEALDPVVLEAVPDLEPPDALDPAVRDPGRAARLGGQVADPGAAGLSDLDVAAVLRGLALAGLVQRGDRGVALDPQVHAP